MNKDDLKYNAEGYRDKTAETAIRAADKPPKSSYQPPYEVTEMVDMFHKIARAYGYDIDNRIAFGIESPEQFTDNRKEKNEMESKRISEFSNENKRRKGTDRLRIQKKQMLTQTDRKQKIAGGLLNGCLGLSGEAGELNDCKKVDLPQKPLDREHMKKEIGDVCWYIADICHSMGFNLDEIFQMNIDKLKPDTREGFSEQRANNRSEGDI